MELRIKDVCREKGITQKELAGLLGVSEMTLSRVRDLTEWQTQGLNT